MADLQWDTAKKKISLSELSLADLIALHTNYWLSRGKGARFELITDTQFNGVENEINKRLSEINFSYR